MCVCVCLSLLSVKRVHMCISSLGKIRPNPNSILYPFPYPSAYPFSLVPWNRVPRGRGKNIPLKIGTPLLYNHTWSYCLLTRVHTHTHTYRRSRSSHPGAKKLVSADPRLFINNSLNTESLHCIFQQREDKIAVFEVTLYLLIVKILGTRWFIPLSL